MQFQGMASMVIAAGFCALGSLASAQTDGAGFIAGTTPSERPAGAPRITAFTPPPGWREQALHAVDAPYPASLSWLDDQGAWFTPFIHPGMTGPYDIRGWHVAR